MTESRDDLVEPCRECRAPLVPGQRYCLYCGTRRPDARLEFLDVLVADFAGAPPVASAAGAVAAAPPPPEPGVNGWLRRHTPILGLTGLLLVALLIGLLVGHWATDDDAPAPARAAAPQVIRVDAGGDGGTAAAATTTPTDAAPADAAPAASADKPAAKADQPKKAAEPESIDSLGTGEQAEKTIKKAAESGAPISVGQGKPAAQDDKAPANGADFETIG